MIDASNVTVGLALLAGLASFLSPCVLALVPAYVGYLSGRSVSPSGVSVQNRWATFGHGVSFVLGFSVVFVALGFTASVLGTILYDLRLWLMRVGGIVVVVFGLHTIGVINVSLFDYDTRRQTRPDPSLGYLSSALMGIFFSAGWAPCVGPVLGAILTLALSSSDVSQGVILLSAYSLGMAIPFLLAALGIGRVAELIQTHSRLIRSISLATGVVLILVGFLLFFGALESFVRFGFFVDFGL